MKHIGLRFVVAVWASFMVATVGPALFGDLLVWAAPITCPGGHVEVQTDVYHPRPGETDITRTPLCTGADGKTTEIPALESMFVIWAGGFLPFLLIMAVLPEKWFGWYDRNNPRTSKSSIHKPVPTSTDLDLQRLGQLKEAFDSGLITEDEYDEKRKEILKKF